MRRQSGGCRSSFERDGARRNCGRHGHNTTAGRISRIHALAPVKKPSGPYPRAPSAAHPCRCTLAWRACEQGSANPLPPRALLDQHAHLDRPADLSVLPRCRHTDDLAKAAAGKDDARRGRGPCRVRPGTAASPPPAIAITSGPSTRPSTISSSRPPRPTTAARPRQASASGCQRCSRSSSSTTRSKTVAAL